MIDSVVVTVSFMMFRFEVQNSEYCSYFRKSSKCCKPAAVTVIFEVPATVCYLQASSSCEVCWYCLIQLVSYTF
jgi:hypothetical protein